MLVDSSVSGAPGASKLVKETPYDTKLTLAGPKDLADLNVGDVVKMGMDADVPYQPVSDSIVSVGPAETEYSGNWSAATVKTGNAWSDDQDVDKLFDNTTTGYASAGANQYATITFSPPISCTKLEIRATTSNNGSEGYLDINGVNYGDATKAFPVSGNLQLPTGTAYTNIGSPPETIETLSIGWKVSWLCVSGIKINGEELLDGVPTTILSDNTKLTLSGDTDLAYFRVGDVVQGNPFVQQFSSNIDGTVVTPEKAFNGVIGDYPEILQQQGTASFTLNFDIPISGELEIRGGTLNDNTAITTVATCSDGTVFPIGNSTFKSLEWYGPETVSNVTSIAFTQDTGRGVSLSAIRLDGELLVDGDIVSSSIVSISKEGDSNHPSITVDGGEWGTAPRNCESDSIESVDTTTDAPNVTLTLSGDKDLACFQVGDVVQSDLSPANGYQSGTPWASGRSWEAFWQGTFNSSGVFAAVNSEHFWNFKNPISGTLVITRAPGQTVAPTTPWIFIQDGVRTEKFTGDYFGSSLTVNVY